MDMMVVDVIVNDPLPTAVFFDWNTLHLFSQSTRRKAHELNTTDKRDTGEFTKQDSGILPTCSDTQSAAPTTEPVAYTRWKSAKHIELGVYRLGNCTTYGVQSTEKVTIVVLQSRQSISTVKSTALHEGNEYISNQVIYTNSEPEVLHSPGVGY
ncbi:hypothetical protein WG66_010857 [Moniliophthora roreri]|nr:hypothetical protein WG66_010857 [Moniliophthora roreri]